jgi:peptide/nickel transport system permease protein
MLALILLYFSVMVFNNSVGGLFSSQYAEAPWSWPKFIDLLRHLWVPALVLGLAGTAFEIRTMRATMLDEKNKLYVTAARAKGLPEWKLLLKYPVRVALKPHCQHHRLGAYRYYRRRAARFVRASLA